MNKPRNWYIHQWEGLAQADFAWRNEEVLNKDLEIHTKYVNMGYRPKGEVIEVVEKVAYDKSQNKIQELKLALMYAQEAFIWCQEMFEARDEMNAKVHCAPVRLSPITERVILAKNAIESALKNTEE